jgi:predicted ATPase
MKLKTARITNYKSIENSEEFSVGALTCLAGKNESGKTAILQALRRLNPVEPSEATFDHTMEFPRSRLHQSNGSHQRVVDTTWELNDEEVAVVEEALGPGTLADRTVRISKGYGSSSLTWEIPLDEEKVIDGVIAQGDELTATAADRVAKHKSVQGIRDMLARQGDKSTVGEKKLIDMLDAFRDGSPLNRAVEVLSPYLPRFLYFPTYEAMPGRVDVEDLMRRRDEGEELTQKDRMFLALLSLARMSVEDVHDQALSEALIARLEGVSNLISRQVFTYWSQNRHLKVRFDYREALPDDPEDGHIFLTRVENTRHGVTVGFDERSAGFVWFFSFLVWFAQAAQQYGDQLVILLDEPGLSLHGRAQADLLRYIKESLLPKHQVIYTTHSPFMIDPADLQTVRTVEDVVKDGEILGTKVGDKVLSTDADTILPLQAALGYDLTRSRFAEPPTD